jgi:hypothetical protein
MTLLAIDDLQCWFCLIYPDDEHRRRISTASRGGVTGYELRLLAASWEAKTSLWVGASSG